MQQHRASSAITSRVIRAPESEPLQNDWLNYSPAERIEAVPAFPVERVIDTTGAGDLFAAGFLSGLARGLDDRTCGRLGALAAAEVIQHLGARPEVSLRQLARENGLAD